jgi:hypothetical protein
MRELLLKNLTKLEKGRKIISVSEVSNRDGYLAHTERHLIYMVKKAQSMRQSIEQPRLYILKVHDSKQKKEKLFFKVKGNFYVVSQNCLYIVYFCHSFKIQLNDITHTNPALN